MSWHTRLIECVKKCDWYGKFVIDINVRGICTYDKNEEFALIFEQPVVPGDKASEFVAFKSEHREYFRPVPIPRKVDQAEKSRFNELLKKFMKMAIYALDQCDIDPRQFTGVQVMEFQFKPTLIRPEESKKEEYKNNNEKLKIPGEIEKVQNEVKSPWAGAARFLMGVLPAGLFLILVLIGIASIMD
jgi:hypothetical protein